MDAWHEFERDARYGQELAAAADTLSGLARSPVVRRGQTHRAERAITHVMAAAARDFATRGHERRWGVPPPTGRLAGLGA